jgi:hypothetical protein
VSQGKELLAVGDDLGMLHLYQMKGKWHMCDLQTLEGKCLSCHSSELQAKRNKHIAEANATKPASRSAATTGYRQKKTKLDKKSGQLQHIENVTVTELRVHESWITRILIIDDLDAIVTCSLDGLVHVKRPLDG